MAKDFRGAEKKNKNPKFSRRGDTSNSQGNIFYEVIHATAVMPQEVRLPKIGIKTADFLESVVIFFAGTVEILMIFRITLVAFGITGGNLLTYLLYAASYPFVLLLNSSQSQIPEMANKFLYENIAILLIYSIVFYGLLKIIKALRGVNEVND